MTGGGRILVDGVHIILVAFRCIGEVCRGEQRLGCLHTRIWGTKQGVQHQREHGFQKRTRTATPPRMPNLVDMLASQLSAAIGTPVRSDAGHALDPGTLALPGRRVVVLTPSYRPDLDKWSRFMRSSMLSLQHAARCDDFPGSVAHHTVLSSDDEVRVFEAALHSISAPLQLSDRDLSAFSITTLQAVLATVQRNIFPGVSLMQVRDTKNKFLVQSAKKFFGCVAFARPGDVCMLLDSGSYVLPGRTVCATASSYFRGGAPTVLVSPFQSLAIDTDGQAYTIPNHCTRDPCLQLGPLTWVSL